MENLFGNAKYIKHDSVAPEYSEQDPAPFFRTTFDITEPIRTAEIIVQSPGFAVYYLNGRTITEDKFISPVSDYRKILWYNAYDVTDLLRTGKNTVGVIVGNGFWNESFDSAWHFQKAPWRDAPQFILHLRVNGKTVLISNEKWKTDKERSYIRYNHLRSGEYVDMRLYDESWLDPDFDDSRWKNAKVRTVAMSGTFRKTECQPIREAERLSPKEVRKTDFGYLVDFGAVISGYAEITLKEATGTEIIFSYTEDIDEDMRPKYNGMDGKDFYPESPFHKNKLIASGKTDRFKPLFSYHGFRYVLIEGLKNPLKACDITAIFLHQNVARRSSFRTGSKLINYIYNAGIRSTYSNLFWSLTDCPTREKLGWANDAQATTEQSLINFDIVPLFQKWFEDLKSSMRPDGSLPGIIPSPDWGFNYGPMCDGLLYELPYRVYLYTGDSRMLIEALEYFVRYADYLTKKIEENHKFNLGDWMGYINSPRIPRQFVAEFYLIKALTVTLLAHKLANRDTRPWEARLHKARDGFLKKYLDREDRCIIDEQASVAMMLATGLFKDAKVLSKQLVAIIRRDELKITCGMVGIQYLYDALTLCGRSELAFKLITESKPGYRIWYENGATTLWESWECDVRGGSKNHHMYSNVLAWFYKSLLGIVPQEESPGFEQIDLRPCFLKELGFAEGTMDTVRGQIEARWSFESSRFLYTVTVPKGIRATFRGKTLSAGKNEFIITQEDDLL
ncbi:MAG: family 78 glycoside hydrolase catalytic domain [Clostridia bacterium]|nr:family 78 glycoside hydrolase catalytic domain [Clostridia bacterium]